MVLCFDSDAAGAKAAERSLDALLENDFIVRVVELPPGEDPDSLVRREGKEQFEKLIANAQDFFDYWIQREIASIDLTSTGAKIQAARNLAATVSRVHDPILRGEVVSKASARLGVARLLTVETHLILDGRGRGHDPGRPESTPEPACANIDLHRQLT